MKLTVTIIVSHDLLDGGSLVRALPLALDSVERAVSAGVAATGPDGMTISPPGLNALVKVGFRIEYAELGERLPSPPADRAQPREHRPADDVVVGAREA